MTEGTESGEYQRVHATRDASGSSTGRIDEFGLESFDTGGSSPGYWYTGGGDERVSLRGVGLAGPRRGKIGPRSAHVVYWLSDGSATVRDAGGVTTRVAPGHPTILSASVSYEFFVDARKLTLLRISEKFLQDVAAQLGFASGRLVLGQQDDLVKALAPLRSLLREVGPSVLDPNVTGAARTALDRRIASTVLDAFPITVVGGTANHRLQDAVGFVQQHAAEPLDLESIASAAGLSNRGLQQMFRRSLGVTPMHYLRDVRLDRAHSDLSAAVPRTTTVATIARRWGFAHVGRFSGVYRDRFGETPAETLRRQPLG